MHRSGLFEFMIMQYIYKFPVISISLYYKDRNYYDNNRFIITKFPFVSICVLIIECFPH